MFGDVVFTCPMHVYPRHMEEVEIDGYLYWFACASPVENVERYGAFHVGELGYIFDNLDLFGAKPTAQDEEFFDWMASVWIPFVKTGKTTGQNLSQLNAY